MSRNRSRVAVAVLVTLAVAGCAKPPVDAIAAAEDAQRTAMAAGAQEYAPEAVSVMTEAKAAMDAELSAQNERMFLRRSFKQAEALAVAYRQAADQATSTANSAREQARQEATTLITESKMALDEVNGLLAAAPVGKGSRADLAAMKADLETAANGLAEAEASLTAERFLEAKSQATSARQIIDQVKASIEQARTMRRAS